MILAPIVFITFFLQTFPNIGYINRRLLLNCSNKKKVDVRKLKKIIYIPHYGVKDKGMVIMFQTEKKFDGYVYRITLILTLINYAILLSNIVLFVLSVLPIATWFLKILCVIFSLISACYCTAIRDYADSLYPI